jgi:hypothetical protein
MVGGPLRLKREGFSEGGASGRSWLRQATIACMSCVELASILSDLCMGNIIISLPATTFSKIKVYHICDTYLKIITSLTEGILIR